MKTAIITNKTDGTDTYICLTHRKAYQHLKRKIDELYYEGKDFSVRYEIWMNDEESL